MEQLNIPIAALLVNSLNAGSYLFGSFVSAPAIEQLCKDETEADAVVLKGFFPAWWPHGAKLMVPLQLASSAINAFQFYETQDPMWAAALACPFANLMWTKLVMMEDIKNLMQAKKLSNQTLFITARRFCATHHLRTGIALAGAFLVAYLLHA
mmetsp:Transcript_7452/g.11984  ORF Transcript_7452/g.11984 Transcript_7452/m.11984 type:complete len:153 (-) Transcript_7452:900-1358(-)|eukprot:CAMPEP_0203749482 /NCGR_PEP_ID=MMETSP0098-20131031/4036_1 /ASSEMBLY_ACC=CAM_ASM_000208 /TAXON_ID=96639 /ORGANISM=" , Strain NY0313808BC1" /LENGTH=152 /DNA_ID=CAMNT_0050638551 /DNA_START=116 /DNA_END=571 /DNA_ORIENTATION=-